MSIINAIVDKFKGFFRFLGRLYNPRNIKEKGIVWTLGVTFATYMIAVLVLWFIWSTEPGNFDVRAKAVELVGGADRPLAPGAITTASIIGVAEKLLHKPGGYISNDVTPPSIFMDNIPSWEFGVVTELRDSVRALRNDFTRAQTQSVEDTNLRDADVQFHFDHAHWILPATEVEYEKGIASLKTYLSRLQNKNAVFFTRADNLNNYFAVVGQRLGNYAQRLSSNVRELRYDEIKQDAPPDQAVPAGEIMATTPWLEIDEVFYEARGYTWALLHVLEAIEIEFRDLLASKNAGPALNRIIHKLKSAQNTVWSPLIMNNSGFGMLTNHSLVLASYIARANSAITDLRILLMQG